MSKDSTNGVVVPRTGSPRVAARSFFKTSCLLRFADFLAFDCAMAYGSRCFLRCVWVDAWWVGVLENARWRDG